MTKPHRLMLVIDTREQRPFDFSQRVESCVGTLACGDYSIRGFEQDVAIERKTLNDLIASITTGRDRFKKELALLRSFRFKALVVEASWSDILEGAYRSHTSINSVIGSLMSFAIRYGIVPILAENHATASKLTERLLLNYANIIAKDHRKLLGDALV